MADLRSKQLPNLKISVDNTESTDESSDEVEIPQEAELSFHDDDAELSEESEEEAETGKNEVEFNVRIGSSSFSDSKQKHQRDRDDARPSYRKSKKQDSTTSQDPKSSVRGTKRLPQIPEKRVYENKQGGFVTGIDVTSKEAEKKRLERAKRFRIQQEGDKQFSLDVKSLYESLGVKKEDFDNEEKGLRDDAVHMRGTTDMSTNDVFHYFSRFPASEIEWINDTSCNVVWGDKVTCLRALLNVSVSYKDATAAENARRKEEKEKEERRKKEEKQRKKQAEFEVKEIKKEKTDEDDNTTAKSADTASADPTAQAPTKEKDQDDGKKKKNEEEKMEVDDDELDLTVENEAVDLSKSENTNSNKGKDKHGPAPRTGDGGDDGGSSAVAEPGKDVEKDPAKGDERPQPPPPKKQQASAAEEKASKKTAKKKEKKGEKKQRKEKKEKDEGEESDSSSSSSSSSSSGSSSSGSSSGSDSGSSSSDSSSSSGSDSDSSSSSSSDSESKKEEESKKKKKSTQKRKRETEDPGELERKRRERKEQSIPWPPGKWRLGRTSKKARYLFMRFATIYDKKELGAEKKSQYYRKYGNPNYGGMKGLISGSRKRKILFAKLDKETKSQGPDARSAIDQKRAERYGGRRRGRGEDREEGELSTEETMQWEEAREEEAGQKPKDLRQLLSRGDGGAVQPSRRPAEKPSNKTLPGSKRRAGGGGGGKGWGDGYSSEELDLDAELEQLMEPAASSASPLPPAAKKKRMSMRMHADEEEERIKARRTQGLLTVTTSRTGGGVQSRLSGRLGGRLQLPAQQQERFGSNRTRDTLPQRRGQAWGGSEVRLMNSEDDDDEEEEEEVEEMDDFARELESYRSLRNLPPLKSSRSGAAPKKKSASVKSSLMSDSIGEGGGGAGDLRSRLGGQKGGSGKQTFPSMRIEVFDGDDEEEDE